VSTWILADAHGGADPDADRDLLRVLDRARAARADLLILGDLFAAWIALDAQLTPFQREVIDRLRGLRHAGLTVRMVVGNRDYLVKEGQLGLSFDEVIDRELVLPLGGVATLVAHGDRINPHDRMYHLWHDVSRSRPARELLLHLPGGIARPLAARTERALGTTNRAYKTGALPFEALQDLGRRAAAQGAARALVGHFHEDRVIEVPNGAPVVIAPDWLALRRILRVDANGALISVDPLAEPPAGTTTG
jgi:UDP-2,3-diacylglucosamine hydrolase